MSERAGSGIIAPLQFLRGIAACAVVVEHLLNRYERRGISLAGLPDLTWHLGETGVFTFFAISGFIMVHIALRNARGSDRTAAGWRFVRDRFTRIAPLYYLTMMFYVAFSYATLGASTNAAFRFPGVAEWLHSFLFLPYVQDDGLIQPIYRLGWTLQYEVFFYALFAVGMVMGARRGMPFVLVTLFALVTAGVWVAEPNRSFGFSVLAYAYTRPVLLYFAIGMAVALLRRVSTTRLPMARPGLLSATALVLTGLAATKWVPGLQMIAIGIALVVVTMVRAVPGRSPLLERLSLALGNASYAIYLTHSFLLGAFAAVTARFVSGHTALLLLAFLIACAASAVVGWLVWRFVEYPLTRRLRGRPLPPPMTVAP